MMNVKTPLPLPASQRQVTISNARIRLLTFCVGAVVANIYYAQPIVDLIARSFALTTRVATDMVSLTQIGYAAGLFLIVPLGDLIESRRLIVTTVLGSSVALAVAAWSQTADVFLIACVLIGMSSVAVQVMVPLAASYAPAAERGRAVGNVVSGLVAGILIARPMSSVISQYFGWRTIFGVASAMMFAVALLVACFVPARRPTSALRYSTLLRSLLQLLRDTPVLRRRALYQGSLFAVFSMFWTTIPIELIRAHAFSPSKVAVFTLIGAAGTLAGPIGGRQADAGRARLTTLVALGGAGLSLLLMTLPIISHSVISIALTAVALDFCVQMNMVVGQRAIFQLAEDQRSRLNALYTTCIFVGGAIGSSLGGALYASGGLRDLALAAGVITIGVGSLAFVLEPADTL